MAYEAVINDNYLCHYNKNHDKRGRFATGDGNGDGIRNNANRSKKKKGGVISGWETDKNKLKKTRQKIIQEQKDSWKKKSKGEKALKILGVAAGVGAVAGIGAAFVINYNKKKANEAEAHQRAVDYVESLKQQMWREKAAKAKFAGGDW